MKLKLLFDISHQNAEKFVKSGESGIEKGFRKKESISESSYKRRNSSIFSELVVMLMRNFEDGCEEIEFEIHMYCKQQLIDLKSEFIILI